MFMSNFIFLKKINEDLFKIISEAEKLFRDEYFEQSIIQIRRFAENLCRDLLKDKLLPDETFDSMINRLKDISFEDVRMQEFTEDLFFIKKQGNVSAHSSKSINDGKIAIECLERAYEIAVFYSNIKKGYDKKLDKSLFSEELLMTGKQSSQATLQEKYTDVLEQTRENNSKKASAPTKKVKNQKNPKRMSNNRISKKDSKNKTLIIVVLVHIILISLCCYFYLNK